MAFLVLHLDLLTDRYVAADVSARDQPEWPPHPGRGFMALAATCFETGEDPDDIAALRFLEKLDPPTIQCGRSRTRSLANTYVPVNDKPTGGGILQTAPGMTRSRRERTFPTTIPESPMVRLCWRIDNPQAVPIEALDRLCGEMIRVGHSSSLVRASAYVTDHQPQVNDEHHVWIPSEGAEVGIRVTAEGTLDALIIDSKRDAIELFATISEAIASAKGREKTQLKQKFSDAFGVAYKQSLRPPEPTPATVRAWAGYRNETMTHEQPIESTCDMPRHFSRDLIVLSKHDGLNFTLSDTLMLTRQLRSALMSECSTQPVPDWISGHDPNGAATKLPHVAIIPIAYVGTRHADGHLMGLAIVPPSRVGAGEFGRAVGPLIYDDDGKPRTVELRFRDLDDWQLRIEDRDEPAMMLRCETWTAPSRIWASVTPVVLDRFPKADRGNDPAAWRAEVAQIILRSCEFAGIAMPRQIEINSTAFVRGVPRSIQKRSQRDNRSIGDGFPSYTTAKDKPPRPQIHVRLIFDRPHAGPVLLGAGRFMGFGFLKPMWDGGRARDGGTRR